MITIIRRCELTVEGITYSNDGSSDNVSVYIDEEFVGRFETLTNFGGGHNWNSFKHSGSMEKKITLNAGNYYFKILVTTADFYGVEIDKTSLEFFCEGDDDVSGDCFESPGTSTKQFSVPEIVGILTLPCLFVGGVVAILTYLTNCYFKRKKLKQSIQLLNCRSST